MRTACKLSLFFLMAMGIAPGVFADSFKNWLLGPDAANSVKDTRSAKVIRTVKLDSVSSECLQCHNGNNSRHVTIKSADSPMRFSASGQQSNHPMGMNYDRYVAKQPASYRSRSVLSPKIVLINGQVGCISCHEQKSREERAYNGLTATNAVVISKKQMCTSKKTLTVGPRKSDLCMACHNM